MLKNFRKKIGGGSNQGFTLVEMLIVVAIIAILIAISIPMVNTALEKARHATDAANERAAKAAMIIVDLGKEKVTKADGTTPADYVRGNVYAYDAKNGKIVTDVPSGYGQHDAKDGASPTPADVKHKGYYIAAYVDTDGTVNMVWTNSASMLAKASVTNKGLCNSIDVGDAHK